MDTEELKKLTLKTYNKNARAFARYFRGIGPRIDDINTAFSYINTSEGSRTFVVEIGCGDGRDAREILKKNCNYLGFDISKGMIALAKKDLPEAVFEVRDANNYVFKSKIDIIFAFASLLHCSKEECRVILSRASKAMNKGGIFYISLKESNYHSLAEKGEYGTRLFYFYKPNDIKEIAEPFYEVVKITHQTIGRTKWFTAILRVRK